MTERPILFNTDMVLAILSGRKTQTRRPVPEWQIPSETNGPHDEFPDSRFISVAQRHPRWGFGVFGATEEACMNNYNTEYGCLCPFGRVGDRLWVRESFRIFDASNECSCYDFPCGCPRSGTPIFRATHDDGDSKWKPSIHMPRTACRIILEITAVRVERLQSVSEQDAASEGFDVPASEGVGWKFTSKHNFKFQWDRLYKNWNENPWVWVVEFKVLTTNGVIAEVAA